MPLSEAVALVTNPNTVVIDASTAHRVAEGWAYGFPELCPEQKEIVANSKRIANPGCYPTGMIALTRPLVDAGYLPEGTGLVVGLWGKGRKAQSRRGKQTERVKSIKNDFIHVACSFCFLIGCYWESSYGREGLATTHGLAAMH